MKRLLLLFSYLLLNFDSFSQLLTTNAFTGSTGTCPTQGNTFSTVANTIVAPLSRNTITCATAANVFNNATLNATASRNDNSYIEFSITANSGFGVNLTSLSFFRQGSNTAPNSLVVSYSTDANAANFNSTRVDMAVSTTTNPGTNITWTFPSAINTTSGGKVTFRFYPFGTVSVNGGVASSSGAFRLDDVSLFGSIFNAAPTLTATPITIPAFNYVLSNGPSTAGSYTLSGSVLTPSAGNIIVTAPTNFEISTISATTGFADNLTVPYAGGALASTTIYARLKVGLAIGTYGPLNINHSGGSVMTPPTVSLSGTVTSVPPPVVTTTGTLSTFNTLIGTPSALQSYTVSGVDLVSDITITAPTDFEIKTGAGIYANIITLTPSSGNVPNTTIDVRLKGTTTGTFPGNISHAATNVSPNVNVAINGVVGAECGTNTDISTIRAALPAVNASTVTVGIIASGTVTGIFGPNKFYLQDATGGIAVFTTGIVTTLGLVLGDQVKITGTSGRRNGEAQISAVTCNTKISAGTLPAPVIFDSNNPSGTDLNTFLATNEGKLIKIISINIPSTGTFSAGTTGVNYSVTTCNNQGGTEIRVDPGSGTLIGSAIPTVTQDITGIVGRFITSDGGTDKLQIFPRSASDLSNSGTTCTVSGGCGVTTFTDSPTQLDVFNWNVEWLGNPTNGPTQSGTNDATQIANARTVLNSVGADVYMLQEVCDYNVVNPYDNTKAFGKLVEGLNNTFGVNTYSGECSSATSGSNADGFAQRVCIIYKNSVVTKVFSRPMFSGFTPATYPPTGNPSQFWSSGRKPFMFMAKVNINSQSDTILFVGIHAKANLGATSLTDYNRRKFDVKAMYDTLQSQYPTRKTIILGDLNDDMDKSIASNTANGQLISSYAPFLYVNPNETAIGGTRPNADWNPISKTLSDIFCASTVSFSDYIDHQIISNEMTGTTSTGFKYVPASVTSFRPIVANYATTTSDHYPTVARYQYFTLPITSIATGNWSSPTTWDCNCVPTATDNVVIDTPHTVTVNVASQAKSINLKGILNYLAPFILSLGQ
jgi:Family of unknown function (DUF5689)